MTEQDVQRAVMALTLQTGKTVDEVRLMLIVEALEARHASNNQ